MVSLRKGPSGPIASGAPLYTFCAIVSVGEIDNMDTKDVSFTDERFAFPGLDPLVLPVYKVTNVTNTSEVAIPYSATPEDLDTGELKIIFFNPFAASIDFGDAVLYFEVLLCEEPA
jgi:hypothetical protein